MDKKIITEQDIREAKTSIPLTLKWALAEYIADFCLDKKQMTIKEKGVNTIALPDVVQRNTLREAQYKIGVFVKEYLNKEYDPVHGSDDMPIPYLMAADDADSWSNFESQIDRLKRSKDKEVADRCYDILNDYHAFVRMVSIEIENELQIKNDLLGRAAWFLSSIVENLSLEDIKNKIGDLTKVEEEPEEAGEEAPVEENVTEE